MTEITCPYHSCGNKFTPVEADLKYEKMGRTVLCPKCKKTILITRMAQLKTGKVHMLKKERLRLRREREGR